MYAIIDKNTNRVCYTHPYNYKPGKYASDDYVLVEVEADKHPKGYSLDQDDNPVYNESYVPQVPSDFVPKISNLTVGHVKRKDHRIINYKTELTVPLFPKRTFVQGELQKVEWYSDEAKTDLVLKVDITYVRDIAGFALERTTERTWLRKNGTEHPNKKTTKKIYDDNGIILEGKRRRGNLVNILMKKTVDYMLETMLTDPQDAVEIETIIQQGRDFMKAHQDQITAFINESHKEFKTTVENSPETWLDNIPGSLGSSIRDYIVGELNI